MLVCHHKIVRYLLVYNILAYKILIGSISSACEYSFIKIIQTMFVEKGPQCEWNNIPEDTMYAILFVEIEVIGFLN
jgi:hypothetical protein